MDKATRSLLTADEQKLVRRTSAASLARLDEDRLGELHDRVRRARNKYAKLHRRQASAQVGKDKARGSAGKKNQRTAQKAEVFEVALADVSHQLAKVATERAAELKAHRLAAAAAVRGGRRTGAGRRASARTGPTEDRGDRARKSPVSKKRAAATRAKGKRAQAKRDAKR